MECRHENSYTAINHPKPIEILVACPDCSTFIGHPDNIIHELRLQLAAAQAELAAEKLSNQIDAACAEQFQDAMQRAEQAEKQLDKMRNCGNCDNWSDCWGQPEEVPGLESCDDHKCEGSTYVQDALIHRMKRMEDALREIASFDGWKSDIAKAALEEKP